MKNRTTQRSLLMSVLLSVFACSVSAQHASIKTATGFLHVYNGQPHSLTLEIVGETVEAREVAGNPAFMVDGELVQVLLVPRSNFDPDRKAKDTDILTAHQTWELDYMKKEVFLSDLKADLEPMTVGERPALFWSFVRTKYKDEFDRDSFMTTRFADGIVGLSTPIKVGDELRGGRDRLTRILKTARFSDRPFDIQKLADSIRKGLPIA